MDPEKGKPQRKYEKPAVLRLATPKAAGDCGTGSGDENCYPTGNSASSTCFGAGNSAGSFCNTGSGHA